jgi:hypothetical protein
VPADRPLPLAAIWNLVSYLPQTSLPVTVALESIAGKYAVVQGFDHGAQSFYPDLDPSFNTLQMMQPGMGYWIRATQTVTLIYPATITGTVPISTALRVLGIGYSNTQYPISDIRQVEADAGVTPTNTWVDFYGPAKTADGAALPVGTVIKAVDPQGVVCGVTVIMAAGQYGLLACYGDDPDTPEDEGGAPGEQIRLIAGERVLGIGYWLGNGERQWVALGKVNLWRQFLPHVGQGDGGQAEPAQPAPKSGPPARQWLPFVGSAGTRSETGQSHEETGPSSETPRRLWLPLATQGGAPAAPERGTAPTIPPGPEPALTPRPTAAISRPRRGRRLVRSAGG